MNNAIIISIALFLYFKYRKNEFNDNTDIWYQPSDDYSQFLLVGTLPFENSVMLYKTQIMKAGQDNGIEAAIIAGVIGLESKGQANVLSDRYIGLMQFGLAEARAMGYTGTSQGLLNPDTNIFWGTKYLKYCINKKNGNLRLGISGYNYGNVEKPSTLYRADYVNEVTAYVPRFRYLLAQAFPGYANVFPKVTWLKTDTIYA